MGSAFGTKSGNGTAGGNFVGSVFWFSFSGGYFEVSIFHIQSLSNAGPSTGSKRAMLGNRGRLPLPGVLIRRVDFGR